ncbi:MAG: DUF2332 domain-containing protein [Opitutales bacterium]
MDEVPKDWANQVDWLGREGSLAEACRRFAAEEALNYAPLYAHFSRALAEDAALLAIMGRMQPGQPQPNLLLYAANRLLNDRLAHPLHRHYPTSGGSYTDPNEVWELFRVFCIENSDTLVDEAAGRTVQTNEVQRCVALYPAFCLVSQLFDNVSLHLLELGTSAGLNLFVDRHAYRYAGHAEVFGSGQSGIELSARANPNGLPPPPAALLATRLTVAARTGLDLQPIDLTDEEAFRWLRACIWPDLPERLQRLERVAEMVRADLPELVSGDAVEDLEAMVGRAVPGHLPVIFHTYMANQLPRARREELLTRIQKMGTMRDLAHVYNNIGTARLCLQAWQGGNKIFDAPIVHNDGHANTVGWLEDA